MIKAQHYKHRVKYSYKFNQPWALKALKRDNYTCQVCTLNKGNLVIHHLDESRKNGYKSMNNSLENLITLCRKCHAAMHKFTGMKETEVQEQVLKLRTQGISFGSIGKSFGFSRQRAHYIYNKYSRT